MVKGKVIGTIAVDTARLASLDCYSVIPHYVRPLHLSTLQLLESAHYEAVVAFKISASCNQLGIFPKNQFPVRFNGAWGLQNKGLFSSQRFNFPELPEHGFQLVQLASHMCVFQYYPCP